MSDGAPNLENTPGFFAADRQINNVSNAILFVVLPLSLVFEAIIVYRVVCEYYAQPEPCWSVQKTESGQAALRFTVSQSLCMHCELYPKRGAPLVYSLEDQ